jgi:hypothetical protein
MNPEPTSRPGARPPIARFARLILARAMQVLPRLGAAERERACATIDRFVEAPGPSTYLAAAQTLSFTLRAQLLNRVAGATIRGTFAAGVSALRRVDGIAPALVTRLETDLPLDPRAGARLAALAALLETYGALAGRIASDTERMRRRFRVRGGRRQPPTAERPPQRRRR